MHLFGWFLLLVLQTAAFTWVSRARNSGSIGYHALASVFSNGIYFVTNIILIGMVTFGGRTWEQLLGLGIVYIVGTVTGAVLMHYVALRWLEKGKRKVGADGSLRLNPRVPYPPHEVAVEIKKAGAA